jgi:hypothetical protein
LGENTVKLKKNPTVFQETTTLYLPVTFEDAFSVVEASNTGRVELNFERRNALLFGNTPSFRIN